MSCYLIWISVLKNWGKLTSNKPLLANILVLVKSGIPVGYKVLHIFVSEYSVKCWRKKTWLEWKQKILFWVFYLGLLYYYQMIIHANKSFILFSLNDWLFSILAVCVFVLFFFSWQLQKEFHAFHLQHSFFLFFFSPLHQKILFGWLKDNLGGCISGFWSIWRMSLIPKFQPHTRLKCPTLPRFWKSHLLLALCYACCYGPPPPPPQSFLPTRYFLITLVPCSNLSSA